MSARYLNIAAYLFVGLDDLARRRKELKAACDAGQLRGTILLSREGINLFIAGEEEAVRTLMRFLTSQPEFSALEVKESWSDHQPFNRMLVRLKAEIISLGVKGIDPKTRTSPKLKPAQLKSWLDQGREVLLLDVRNDYEVGVGTFKGARAIGLDHFRNFPVAVAGLPEDMKQKPVVMFCTGGIRCEKAGPYMEQQGFQNIFQLEGGILKYFEDCGSAHYEGGCFVFDKRVALDPDLKESGLAMCFACQAVLSPEDQSSPAYVIERSCPHCIDRLPPGLPSLEHRHRQLRSAVTPLPGSVAYDNVRPIRIPERLDGQSLATSVAHLFPHMSDEYWQGEFRSGRVRLGDRVVDGALMVKAGQRYTHCFPDTIEPQVNADIRILFEDDSLLVVDKPAPLPMHPSGRFNRNTLIWILRHAFSLPALRPIHRLDANTTGIAMFAKTKAFAGQMQRLFDACQIEKTYLAQCVGVPPHEDFECTAPITRSATATGGRKIGGATALDARTRFVRIGISDDTATLEAFPITGRTNQIRLHLWHLGHPLVGDPLYLPNHQLGQIQTMAPECADEAPMRLHAWRVEFTHPQTAQLVTLRAPEPTWFNA